MKRANIHSISCLIVLLSALWSVPVFGQEDRGSEYEPGKPVTPVKETARERDVEGGFILSPGEARNSTITRDSIGSTATPPPVLKQNQTTTTQKQPVRPAEGRNQKEEDPSVLSFNFLYYIIQRFKLSDIVD